MSDVSDIIEELVGHLNEAGLKVVSNNPGFGCEHCGAGEETRMGLCVSCAVDLGFWPSVRDAVTGKRVAEGLLPGAASPSGEP